MNCNQPSWYEDEGGKRLCLQHRPTWDEAGNPVDLAPNALGPCDARMEPIPTGVTYVEVDRETVVDHTTRLSFSIRVF